MPSAIFSATPNCCSGQESASEAGDLLPKPTLYINNLNEKLKPEELKHSLFHLFSLHGEIL